MHSCTISRPSSIFDNPTIDLVADAYGRNAEELEAAFATRFNSSLKLAPERHIVFVAPDFDVTCHVTVPYLLRLGTQKGISCHLFQVVLDANGDVRACEPARASVAASTMAAGSCGVSLRGTLYVVLSAGIPPLLWRVGTLNGDSIVRSARPRLRLDERLLTPLDALPNWLDLSPRGSTWVKTFQREKAAIVLGRLKDDRGGWWYDLVRQCDGRFERIRRKHSRIFDAEWHPQTTVQFNWGTLRNDVLKVKKGAGADDSDIAQSFKRLGLC